MKTCFNCADHNLSCFDSNNDNYCTYHRSIDGTPDDFKRRATDLERVQAQLDRIEKQNNEMLSYLAPKMSRQEERANDAGCELFLQMADSWSRKYKDGLEDFYAEPDGDTQAKSF